MESYRRALTIRQTLTRQSGETAETRYELASLYTKLAERLEAVGQKAEALVHFRRVLAFLTTLSAEQPQNRRFWQDRVYVHLGLNNLSRRSGDHASARREVQAARALMEAQMTSQDRTANEAAVSYNDYARYGALLRKSGEGEAALLYSRQALLLAQEAAEQAPYRVSPRAALYSIHREIAIVLTQMKEYRAALEHYQQAHEAAASQATLDPDNMRLQYRLVQSHGALANALERLGDNASALHERRKGVTIEEALLADPPTQAPLEFADRLKKLGDMLHAEEDYEEALKQYQRALRRIEPVGDQAPADPQAQRRTGIYLYYIGNCRLKLGDTQAAREPLHKMLRLREELWAAARENPDLAS